MMGKLSLILRCFLVLISLAASTLVFQNCSPAIHDMGLDQSQILSSTFIDLKSNIFNNKCLSCHDAGDPNFTSYNTLMSGTNIVAGDANASQLYLRVNNGTMPPSGKLSDIEIAAIYEWIQAGAPDDDLTGSPPVLSATALSASQINLSWLDNTSNETGFKLERSASSNGPYVEIQKLTEGITFASDTGLTAATTYYYRICAYNGLENGAYSNYASATTAAAPATPPTAPNNLLAQAQSSSLIHVSWQDNSADETEFQVERSTNGGAYSLIATLSANSLSYDNSGLQPSTSYAYRVRAANSAGNSNYSNTVNAITMAALSDTFTSLNANIFITKCVSCHSGNAPKGGYKMTNYAEVLTRVVPSNSAGSLLYKRTADGSMPKAGALSPNEINQIKSWIDKGAVNN